MSRDWSPGDSLQSLADKTSSGLTIREEENPTNGVAQDDIQNLLATINCRVKKKLNDHGGMSGLFGLFAGVMISLYVGTTFPTEGLHSLYVWIGLPLLGLIIGGLCGRAVIARFFVQKEIKSALARHHLEPADLSRQITSTGISMPIISKQLEKMAK